MSVRHFNLRMSVSVLTALSVLPISQLASAELPNQGCAKYSTTMDNFLNCNFKMAYTNEDYYIHSAKGLFDLYLAQAWFRAQSKVNEQAKINLKESIRLESEIRSIDEQIAKIKIQAEYLEKQKDFIARHQSDPKATMEAYRAYYQAEVQKYQTLVTNLENAEKTISGIRGQVSEVATTAKVQANQVLQQTDIKTSQFDFGSINSQFDKTTGEISKMISSAKVNLAEATVILSEANAVSDSSGMPESIRQRIATAQVEVAKLPALSLDKSNASIAQEKLTASIKGTEKLTYKLKNGLRRIGYIGTGIIALDSAGALYIVHYLGKDPTISPAVSLIANKTPEQFLEMFKAIPTDFQIVTTK